MIARAHQIKIETLPEQLRQLDDQGLVAGLALATRGERAMTMRVLHHLNEMERRELHIDLGYSSLFDYCVRKLGYSPSGAGRRIQAARCIRRFPEVLGMLATRDLSLSVVALIEPVLTDENFASVMDRIRGKSFREVERVMAEYRPPLEFRDNVRPVRVAVPARDVDAALFDRECSRRSEGRYGIATEEKVFVQFLADPELMDLFEEVRALLSRNGEHLSFAEVLRAVLVEYRERHCPIARQQRREARKGAKSPDSQRWELNDSDPARSRHIPINVQDEIFARDECRCTYVATDGTRCGSRYGLQVDHIRPFALGGTHDPSNLRLLCAAHNRRAATRAFGTDHMRPFYARR